MFVLCALLAPKPSPQRQHWAVRCFWCSGHSQNCRSYDDHWPKNIFSPKKEAKQWIHFSDYHKLTPSLLFVLSAVDILGPIKIKKFLRFICHISEKRRTLNKTLGSLWNLFCRKKLSSWNMVSSSLDKFKTPTRMNMFVGDMIRIPADGFALFHWSTIIGVNQSRN